MADSPLPVPGSDGPLNRWFDRIPRLTVDVGDRSLPVFRSMGIIGFQLALVVSILSGLRVGLPLVVTLGLSSVAGLSFFAWALLRRALAGRESLVLLEHVWVALAAVAGYLWLAGAPILTGLDVCVTGLAVFLGMGRIGCLTVGCCHGTPTGDGGVGIRYGPGHNHVPPWLMGRRLRPVQLIEAVALFTIAVAGFALLASPAGTTTVWFLASYAVVRFGTESLRGDQRPRLGTVPVARLMALAQLGAAMVVAERSRTGSWPATLVATDDGDMTTTVARLAPLALALLAGAALQRRRRADPLTAHAHLVQVWRAIETAAGTAVGAAAPDGQADGPPVMTGTDRKLSIAVSAVSGRTFHVSFHHPDHDPAGLARILGSGAITTGSGIVHLLVDVLTVGVASMGPPSGMPGVVSADVPADVRGGVLTGPGRSSDQPGDDPGPIRSIVSDSYFTAPTPG